MRIGIIGASGFIGSALTRAAVSRGHEVIAFSRRPGLVLEGVREVRGVAAAGPAIDPSGLDAVVNLAGESVLARWTERRKERIRESRIALTRRVVESLPEGGGGTRVLLSASGTGAYGNRGDEVLTEESAPGGGFLGEVCAGWEAAARGAESRGVRVVLLRTGLVLGNGGGAWPLLHRVFRLGLGGPLGNGRQWVPWIHLEDEVGIMLHALEHAACAGPMNLAAPGGVTNRDLTRAVAWAVRRPAVFAAPAFALRLVLGEMADALLDSQRVEPRAALDAGYAFKFPELEGALASLL